MTPRSRPEGTWPQIEENFSLGRRRRRCQERRCPYQPTQSRFRLRAYPLTHYHQRAENVDIVLEGVVQVVIDGKTHRLQAGEGAFIPPGVPHAAGNGGAVPARFIEIYAPAGKDYHLYELARKTSD